MSRQEKRRLLATALAVASLGVAACGGGDEGSEEDSSANQASGDAPEVPFTGSVEDGLPTSYPDPEPEDLTIGLLSPRQASEVVADQFNPAAEQVEELGGEAILLDAEANPDLQVSQFEQLINREVDAIAVIPIADPKLLRPLLERAARAEIPVVGIEVTPGQPDPAPGFASQVWQARDRQAYLQVRAAAEALPEGAQVGRIGFALPVPLFEYSAKRTEFWAKRFDLEIVDEAEAEADEIDAGQEAATGLIAGNPEMTGILGFVDEAAIGASLAARAAGRDELQTFGVDGVTTGLRAVESGRLAATVFLDRTSVGRELAKGLYGAAQGLKIPPVVVIPDPFIVRAENVDDVPE